MAEQQVNETATEEETTTQTDEQIEQENAEAERAFEAGFNKSRTAEADRDDDADTAETPQETDEATTRAKQDADADEPSGSDTSTGGEKTGSDQRQQQAASQAAENLIAGMPEEQVKALLVKAGSIDKLQDSIAKEFRKVYGRLGSLGSQRKLTPGDLKRLKEDYPDLATALAEDLADVLQAGGGQSLDEEQIQQLITNPVNEKLAELDQRDTQRSREFEKRLLKRYEPEWQKVVTSSDYLLWLQNQEAEYRDRIDNSWNADEIYDSILLFRKAQDDAKAKQKQAELEKTRQNEEEKTRRSENNQRRLRGNLQPDGTGEEPQTGISDEQAFQRGFRKARANAGM